MSFIEQNLNKGEKLDRIAKPSLKPALLALIVFVGTTIAIYLDLTGSNFFGVDKSNPNTGLSLEWQLLLFLISFFFVVKFYMERFFNEYGISDQRIISKTGVISRSIEEMSLKSIESVNVKQSIFGRIFNYGSIVISGRGSAMIKFKDIDSPVEVRKKIQNKS
jgi:uncharacterized membrane protein YdbT with pleckstrin-like domain